jgi:hypothetical protein
VSGWNRRGSTTAWRRLRALVLVRDGYRCQVPAEDRPDGVCGEPARTVGHMDARALGGPLLAPMNRHRAECSAHNYAEGARLGAALRRARIVGHRPWSW